MSETSHGPGNLYPIVVMFVEGMKVAVFPLIVEAVSIQEARGKAYDIGLKFLPNFPGRKLEVDVGDSGIAILENIEYRKNHGN